MMFATKHGESHGRLYSVWNMMKQRCGDPNNAHYKNYGGRGIKVCAEWQEYAPFREWALANGYAEGLTIDRIDNNKGYSPENCRWVTMLVQMRNTRRNRFIEYNGERKTVSAFAAEAGMKYGTLWGRLKRGMNIEDALKHTTEKRSKQWEAI